MIINRTHIFSFIAFTAALAAASTSAHADENETPAAAAAPTTTSSSSFGSSAGPFGAPGQWVYSLVSPNEFPLEISKTGDSDWGLTLRPAADTFIVRNVSVGGIVTLSKYGGGSDIGVGARAGYNVGLTSLVTIWIRGGLYYHHQSVDNGPSSSQTLLDITVPFLFHIVPHFFVGLGPMFHLPLQQTQGPKDATYGITGIVGGWF
jgi:hypothetical protein